MEDSTEFIRICKRKPGVSRAFDKSFEPVHTTDVRNSKGKVVPVCVLHIFAGIGNVYQGEIMYQWKFVPEVLTLAFQRTVHKRNHRVAT